MTYFAGFVWVLTLSGVAIVACDDSPEWRPGQCETYFPDEDGNAAYMDVADGTPCIYSDGGPGVCVAGVCERRCGQHAGCSDYNDCTANLCDVASGLCSYVAVADGQSCAGGICQSGACALTDSRLPCVEQGVRNAVAAGGGPYTFACDGPTTVTTEAEIAQAVPLLERSRLLVDGLLGTGFEGRVREPLARLIESVAELCGRLGIRVVALDLPSGLDCDTGAASGPVLRADLTVTFAAPKLGFAAEAARTLVGEVKVVSIGTPREWLEA